VSDFISTLSPYWQSLWQSLSQSVQLQLDLAAAAIAVVALVVSRRAYRNQERLSLETLRVQRDNDVIQWTNGVIDTLVSIEFHLRDWARAMQPQQFVAKRDEFLADLSAAIDKGRLYFPHFAMDVIGPRTAAPPPAERQAILDRLVDIYDLIKGLDARMPDEIEMAREKLLLRKRGFMAQAQREVNPQRRRQFIAQNG
jgi:hypothetical protein